jgi:hypothetical protein
MEVGMREIRVMAFAAAMSVTPIKLEQEDYPIVLHVSATRFPSSAITSLYEHSVCSKFVQAALK